MHTIIGFGTRACLRCVGALPCLFAGSVLAQEPAAASAADEAEKDRRSWSRPSLNPKLGASFGVIAAYLHYFDEKSRPSTFGIGGQCTTTESAIATLFARASWVEDNQRLIALPAAGSIRNDYDDYLGTGVPLQTNDELRALVGRHLHHVHGGGGERWTSTLFVGVAVLYGDMPIGGNSEDFFPNVGAGLQYLLKKKEGILLNLEAAAGENDNYGVYIKLGHGF
jgi:hypothetical protein